MGPPMAAAPQREGPDPRGQIVQGLSCFGVQEDAEVVERRVSVMEGKRVAGDLGDHAGMDLRPPQPPTARGSKQVSPG